MLGTTLAVFLGVVAGGCMNPSLPTDLILNLPGTPHDQELEATERTLVVLQHGLWRSWGSMWRLERALEAHGYEVLNTSYPSTRAHIEDHAQRLAKHIEERVSHSKDPFTSICFVGHSMGGLVIRSYLQSEDARDAWACVFIATPQRGATLAQQNRDGFWFQLVLGTKSASQLAPSDPYYAELAPLHCEHIGVISGGKGDDSGWSDKIPGDDDGAVGADEARLPEQTDAIRLRLGHTRLGFAAQTIRQVLVFLRHGEFEDPATR